MAEQKDWTWNKDGEFWFDDAYGEVGGGLNHSGHPYTVGFDFVSGARSSPRLLKVLRIIKGKFPEYEICLELLIRSDMRQLLEELASKGSIKWEETCFSSKAKILYVKEPEIVSG